MNTFLDLFFDLFFAAFAVATLSILVVFLVRRFSGPRRRVQPLKNGAYRATYADDKRTLPRPTIDLPRLPARHGDFGDNSPRCGH
jgi:hypothetical protein